MQSILLCFICQHHRHRDPLLIEKAHKAPIRCFLYTHDGHDDLHQDCLCKTLLHHPRLKKNQGESGRLKIDRQDLNDRERQDSTTGIGSLDSKAQRSHPSFCICHFHSAFFLPTQVFIVTLLVRHRLLQLL